MGENSDVNSFDKYIHTRLGASFAFVLMRIYHKVLKLTSEEENDLQTWNVQVNPQIHLQFNTLQIVSQVSLNFQKIPFWLLNYCTAITHESFENFLHYQGLCIQSSKCLPICQPCEQVHCSAKREHLSAAYLPIFLSTPPLSGITSYKILFGLSDDIQSSKSLFYSPKSITMIFDDDFLDLVSSTMKNEISTL